MYVPNVARVIITGVAAQKQTHAASKYFLPAKAFNSPNLSSRKIEKNG